MWPAACNGITDLTPILPYQFSPCSGAAIGSWSSGRFFRARSACSRPRKFACTIGCAARARSIRSCCSRGVRAGGRRGKGIASAGFGGAWHFARRHVRHQPFTLSCFTRWVGESDAEGVAAHAWSATLVIETSPKCEGHRRSMQGTTIFRRFPEVVSPSKRGLHGKHDVPKASDTTCLCLGPAPV